MRNRQSNAKYTMNKIFIFLIFSLVLSFSTNAQESTFKFSQASIKIDINEEVFEEAELKGISDDKVYISFTMAINCDVYDFKISKPGKLKSFNLLV